MSAALLGKCEGSSQSGFQPSRAALIMSRKIWRRRGDARRFMRRLFGFARLMPCIGIPASDLTERPAFPSIVYVIAQRGGRMIKMLKQILAHLQGEPRTIIRHSAVPGFDPVRAQFEAECG